MGGSDIGDLSFLLEKGGDATANEAPILASSIAEQGISPRKRRSKITSNVIAVRLDSGGKIDSDHMRGETLKRLKEAVQKSDLIETQEEKSAVYAMLIPAVYKVVGGLEALLAAYLLKVPRQDAAEVFAYTDAEIAVLQQPTANVLAKYSGTWMLDHGDELALAFHLMAIHQLKLEALKERTKEKPETPKVAAIR